MQKLSPKAKKNKVTKKQDVDFYDKIRGDYVKAIHSSRSKPKGYSSKDEYYTLPETVEKAFSIIDTSQFKDKVIYCPCDSDKSEWVKYISKHKDEFKLKELIYTSDDYNNHIDLFEKADFVITNPPFSKIYKELLPILIQTKTRFFMVGSALDIHIYKKAAPDAKFSILGDSKFITPFQSRQRPDINIININNIIALYDISLNEYARSSENKYSSLAFFNRNKDKFKNFSDCKYCNITFDGAPIGDFPIIDYVRDFPKDYDGWVLAPITALLYEELFDIDIDSFYKFYRIKGYVIKYSDNINRYIRILIKKNNNPLWDTL